MRSLRAWLLRLAAMFSRHRHLRELGEELESHVQFHTDDNIRAGMSPGEARRQAIARLGGFEQTKLEYRDAIGFPRLDTIVHDVRGGFRLIRRSPGFAAVAVLTLALGIGANTVMFSVVNTVLLRPLPYPAPEALVSAEIIGPDGGLWQAAPPDFEIYRSAVRGLDSLDAYYVRPRNLTDGNEPERVSTLIASGGFFETLRVQPSLGRAFGTEHEVWGAHRVAVLSDGLWRRRFASDPSIIGRALRINGEPYVVIGVLPSSFSFLGFETHVFIPMSFAPGDNLNTRNNYFLSMIGRLGAGGSSRTVGEDMNRISAEIARIHPQISPTAARVRPLREALVGDVRRAIYVLSGAVGLVLLLTCANLANLLLARGAVREREIALRAAIGATRGRLVLQLLTESFVLSALGAVTGLAVTWLAVDSLNLLSQAVLPRVQQIRVDGAVLAFTAGAALVTTMLCGVLPAVKSSRTDVNGALKDGGRNTGPGSQPHRLRVWLVVAEVALSLLLLAGAGLLVKSMQQLLRVDRGFDSAGVLTLQVNIPPQKYVDAALERQFNPRAYTRAAGFYTGLIDLIRGVPGVRAVGATSGLPLLGDNWGKTVTLYDRPLPRDLSGLPSIQYRVVAGDYFRALGIRIVSGRPFTDGDRLDAAKVAIVNREFERRFFDGRSSLGTVVSVNPPVELLPAALLEQTRASGVPADYTPTKFTIVGVADDVRYAGLHLPVMPVVYAPYAQGSEGATNMFLAVKADVEAAMLVPAIRERVRLLDAQQPISNIAMMDDRLRASVAQLRLQTMVLGTFAAVALVLAVVGIYGVVSYSVSQRSRELGIRMALGARRTAVLSLVMRQALLMIGTGLLLGLMGALATTQVMQRLLHEVSPTDPGVLATVVAVLGVSGALAAYLPALRATRLDPIVVLKNE